MINQDQAFIDGFIKAAFTDTQIPAHGGMGMVGGAQPNMNVAIPQPGQPQPGQPQPGQPQPRQPQQMQKFFQLMQQYSQQGHRVPSPPTIQPQF